MRKLTLIFSILLFTLNVFSQRVLGRYPIHHSRAVSGWIGLDLWYEMNDASGNIVESVIGDDAVNTGATYGATGKVGDALDFEESEDDYITMGTGFNYGSADFSITCWVNLESTGDQSVCGGLLNSFFFNIRSTGALSAGKTNVLECTPTSTVNVSTGTLTFIGVSYNQSTDEFRFRAGSNYETESFTYTFEAATRAIGSRNTTAFSFDGIIDEFNVWDHVLTNDEWDYLYNSNSGRAYADNP